MKFGVLLALVGFATIGQLVLAEYSILDEWNQYKQLYGKVYPAPDEDARRFSQFLLTKERIRQHNADENASYKLGVNQFSDWTQDEPINFRARPARNNISQQRTKSVGFTDDHPFFRSILDNPSAIPDEVDWRNVAGRVTDVKSEDIDRDRCQSDYAFATVGVLEGQLLVRQPNRTKLVSLSAQQLVDCMHGGCGGSTVEWALNYIANAGGIESEEDYPYVANQNDMCGFDKKKVVIANQGYLYLSIDDDESLRKTVASFGPVAIQMQMGNSFRYYHSGIYDESTCNNLLRSKYVLLVGYGNHPIRGEYWIVKNSWGTSWGEQGYMRVKRGNCGIGYNSFIPLFVN